MREMKGGAVKPGHLWLLGGLSVVVLAAGLHPLLDPGGREFQPRPTEGEPGERDPDFKQQRKAWMESLHRHAPGLDWRAQDAQWRAQRIAKVQAQRNAAIAAGADRDLLRQVDLGAISGSWRERGSGNQAGRVTGAIYDAATHRLTTLSQGGNVWRADRDTLAWNSPSDSVSFVSDGFLDRLGGAGERLLVGSDSPSGVYYSDNGGLGFTAATGADLSNPWYTMGMAVRDVAANDVYLTRVHYDGAASNWRAHLFASTNRGAAFMSLGFVGERERVALFSPRYGSNEMYLLVDATLNRIVSGTQALVPVGTVPFSPAVANGDRVTLSGGVDAGQVFLYAFRSRGSQTDVYRSLDGGQNWQARTPVPSGLFGPDSTETSTRNASLVYAGGVDLYRSIDGAAGWTKVNDWGEYYGNPANKLHADIPDIDVWLDGANTERVLVSTDGGLYESTDDLATVHNLSLQGLHVSQYYASHTGDNGHVFAGAQDQGYQKALSPGGGIDDFVQTISGDYGHLDSTDGGASLWMVYPGFAMLDTATSSPGQGGLHRWDYADHGFSGALWMAPIVVDPLAPQSALLAGGRLTGSGHHVVRLTWSGSALSAVQDGFDFGSEVTALAFSAHDSARRYAINSDREFFRYSGGSWSHTASNLPENHFFYGNTILSDPARPDTVYVAGAGYSNPAVFVSTDDGNSFAPMATGLPDTLVFKLAISPDGEHLFAATELGSFHYDRALGSWVDLGGLGGPDQVYWDVDYVEQGGNGIARFATYGRGIWDFVLTGDRIFADGFEQE
jgi:hypothetical protein